jgi:hypothetical protein
LNAVYEGERNDREVVFGLYGLAFFFEEREDCVVFRSEKGAGYGRESGEDITGGGAVGAAGEASAELTVWFEEVYVVGADKPLRQHHNSTLQTHLPMMICRVLCHIPRQLRHFNLSGQVAFEAGEKDFSLTGFQPVAHGWDGAGAVCDGE